MIGIDLGGTRIKAVTIDEEGNILHQYIVPTNDGDNQSWKNAVKESVDMLLQKINIDNPTIGISAPGLPDQEFRSIKFMPGRLEGLENYIWSMHLGQNAFVLNDGVAALVAEARFGAAKNKENVVMITLGTGVGGAILINGQPYGGAFNKAGHVGHMVIDYSADADVTNMPGSMEECIGNCTIEKRSQGKYKSTHELLLDMRNGNEFAKHVWTKSVKQLAIGIASLTNILSPEVIVLGGGITEAGDDLFIPLKENLAMYEWRAGGFQVEIVKAHFGEMAGAIGAAVFGKERIRV